MGCGSSKLPFTYLGPSVGALKGRTLEWLSVIENMKNQLSVWMAKMISFGGRRSLVKSILGSVSLYFFSLFRAPVSMLK